MTENEAIEELKMFPVWNMDDQWLNADDMEELIQDRKSTRLNSSHMA